MSFLDEMESARAALRRVQGRLVGDSQPAAEKEAAGTHLRRLLSLLDSPTLSRMLKIQDSLWKLRAQLAAHPSLVPADFEIVPETGELQVSISPLGNPGAADTPPALHSLASALRPAAAQDPPSDNPPADPAPSDPPANDAPSQLESSATPNVTQIVFQMEKKFTPERKPGQKPEVEPKPAVVVVEKIVNDSVADQSSPSTPALPEEVSIPVLTEEKAAPSQAPRSHMERALTEAARGRPLHTVQLYKQEGTSLGFSVAGLSSEPNNEFGIFVQEIQPNGIAARDGRLREGDQILAIDGQPLDVNISHPQAISILQNARGEVELVVARAPDPASAGSQSGESPATLDTGKSNDMVLNTEWAQVEVIDLVNDGTGLGFGIIGGRSTGVVVKTILPGGVADRDGRLQSGDHILQIGPYNLRGMESVQVAQVLRTAGTQVRLIVARPVEPTAADFQADPSVLTRAPIVPTRLLADPDELDHQLQSLQNQFPEPYTQDVITEDPGLTNGQLGELGDLPLQMSYAPVATGLTLEGAAPATTSMVGEAETCEVELVKDVAGLGVTIAGYVCEREELSGIFIKSVNPGSAADLSGRVAVNDQIIEVDGTSLQGYSNQQAVELLKRTGPKVRLRLARYTGRHKDIQPHAQEDVTSASSASTQPMSTELAAIEPAITVVAEPAFCKPVAVSGPVSIPLPGDRPAALLAAKEPLQTQLWTNNDVPPLLKPAQDGITPSFPGNNTSYTEAIDKQVLLEDLEKLIDSDYQGTLRPQVESALQLKWGQILGDDYQIVVSQLSKFASGGGLGVSLEGTVDVEDGREVRPHHYIRSILTDGPVGVNDRLRGGDELLEVNGKRLLGLNHMEVVNILKELPVHVRLVCARRSGPSPLHAFDVGHDREQLANRSLIGGSLGQLYPDRLVKAKSDGSLSSGVSASATDTSLSRPRSRSMEPLSGLAMWAAEPQQMVLHKGERGLGFSILDYQDPMNPAETVIVIRSLVPGGAAQLDGRLVPGDRLLSVNDVRLENASLDEAVQALKGAPPGPVRLGVAKPLPLGADTSSSQELTASSHSEAELELERLEGAPSPGSVSSEDSNRLQEEEEAPLPPPAIPSPPPEDVSELSDAVDIRQPVLVAAARERLLSVPVPPPWQQTCSDSPALSAVHTATCNVRGDSATDAQTAPQPADWRGAETAAEWLTSAAQVAPLTTTEVAPLTTAEVVPVRTELVPLPAQLQRTATIKKGAEELGLNVEFAESGDNGVPVKSVTRGSAAHRDGSIRAGDYIVSLNNESLQSVTQAQAKAVYRRCQLSTDISIVYVRSADAAVHHEAAQIQMKRHADRLRERSQQLFPQQISPSSPYFGADAPPLLRSNTEPDLFPHLLHRQPPGKELDTVSAFSLPHSAIIAGHRVDSPQRSLHSIDVDHWEDEDEEDLLQSCVHAGSPLGTGTQTPGEEEPGDCDDGGTTLLTVEVDGNAYNRNLLSSGLMSGGSVRSSGDGSEADYTAVVGGAAAGRWQASLVGGEPSVPALPTSPAAAVGDADSTLWRDLSQQADLNHQADLSQLADLSQQTGLSQQADRSFREEAFSIGIVALSPVITDSLILSASASSPPPITDSPIPSASASSPPPPRAPSGGSERRTSSTGSRERRPASADQCSVQRSPPSRSSSAESRQGGRRPILSPTDGQNSRASDRPESSPVESPVISERENSSTFHGRLDLSAGARLEAASSADRPLADSEWVASERVSLAVSESERAAPVSERRSTPPSDASERDSEADEVTVSCVEPRPDVEGRATTAAAMPAPDLKTPAQVAAPAGQQVAMAKHWGPERLVVVRRSPSQSLGISIVGGKVDLSNSASPDNTSSVISGIFIKNVLPDSVAGRTAQLKTGDRILAVGDTDLRGASHDQAVEAIRSAGDIIEFLVQSLVARPAREGSHGAGGAAATPDSSTDGQLQASTAHVNGSRADGAASPEVIQPGRPAAPAHLQSAESVEEDEDVRTAGRFTTPAGMEIDRASAGFVKLSRQERVEDTEPEDQFMYTTKKIQKKYGDLGGELLLLEVAKGTNGLGISLAGNKDRTRMSVLVCGLNPQGNAYKDGRIKTGDEIMEVNGQVLHGRCHLNASAIIKGIAGPTIKIIILRRQNALDNLAVPPITQFPVALQDETPEQKYAKYKGLRSVQVKKGSSGLGIMIFEGKHTEVGQGIFISDLQAGSPAEQAGLAVGDMILCVNFEDLVGADYDTAASILKRAEGVLTLWVANPSKVAKQPSPAATPIAVPTTPTAVPTTPTAVPTTPTAVATTPTAGPTTPAAGPTKAPTPEPEKPRIPPKPAMLSAASQQQKPAAAPVQQPTAPAAAAAPAPAPAPAATPTPKPVPITTASVPAVPAVLAAVPAGTDGTTLCTDEPPADPATCPIQPSRQTTIEISKEKMGLGLSIVGGSDTLLGAIIIHEVYPDGAAARDGRLKPGDQLLEVNSENFRDATHNRALAVLRQTPAKVKMLVYREEGSTREEDVYETMDVEMVKKPGKGLGLSIVGRKNGPGVFISDLVKGGAAEADGRLVQGDQILTVNGQDLKAATQEQAAAILKTSMGRISMKVGRLKVRAAAGGNGTAANNKVPDACAGGRQRLVVLERGGDGLGFSVVGGHASPHGHLPIYVKTVFERGAAADEGTLRRGDMIVSVNGVSLSGATHQRAVQLLTSATGTVTLLVES